VSAGSERVAIVAGAGNDLGRVTAEKLAAAGYTVAGIDRSEEAMKGLPDGIGRAAADPAAALWLTQAVVPYLRERGAGAIVHVAARPGLEPAAGMAAYAVSKAALAHLTRVLDLELRPLGIRVNAVARQQLDTAKTHPYLTPGQLAHAVTPQAIADIIAYLVSDAAAPISGAIVPAYGP
jgi:NAD(P)-dependent dehydrogenase (short-subunit alcohol dehydrogenase family)